MRIVTVTLLSLLMIMDNNSADARKRKKRTEIELNSDTDVLEYLKKQEQDMKIFKCKRLVIVKWLHSVLPYIDLQCQVMGDVSEVHWFYNDTRLNTENKAGRHMSLSQPHYRKGKFYDKWFDYKLRLLQVTEKDNGWYTFRATSRQGYVEEGIVLLEVMTEYRDDKWIDWMDRIYKDNNKKKRKHRGEKKDAQRLAKRRQKDLMKMIKKRAQEMRKSTGDGPPIFVGN